MIKSAAAMALALSAVAAPANALGWPANYEGVMLQGFYWDSYNETSWSKLTSMSDELSQYFKLIWVPNSAQSEGMPTMGYHPIYWFTNHNCSFGSESQLRTMISTYKSKGTGIIADVVINHRSGKSNWTDFPTETWNGKTYKIGPEGICCDDEVAGASGQAKPTGAYDTGEGWGGSRDLDHTNYNVQQNCKDYIKCLLTDYGYSGVRYDFVKGYNPYYNKMYNEANGVTYSVGEYWDGNYDLVKNWIDGTGKTSAAFDFPFKYQLNKAFNGWPNYSELVWKAYGVTDQPAGMIHADYQQYSVTFVDNHDSYRDGSKYTGDVLIANAFMLSSPGTPCVFYPHYKQYKSQIQALINARNGVGVHNCSPVRVIETNNSCYVAEVTGSRGKLWVKLGSSGQTPGAGYTKKASGNGYEVWTTAAQGGQGTTSVSAPDHLYLIGNFSKEDNWDTNGAAEMTKSGNKFTITHDIYAPEQSQYGYYTFISQKGASWDVVNSSDRFGAATKDMLSAPGQTLDVIRCAAGEEAAASNSWAILPGKYNFTVDFATMKLSIVKDTSTLDETTLATEEQQVRWFTLQGIEVSEPTHGVYIRVSGTKTEKVVL